MNNKIIYRIGILGVSLFVTASIVGGLLIEDYSVTSQYISESFAIDTVYGGYLRSFGYIPSGILIIVFCFYGSRTFQSLKLTKIGFLGLGIFYGLATIMVGLFPCDSGCNKEFINPSISQIIHNIAALLTYVFVPASLILVGIGLKKLPNFQRLSIQIITYGILSFFFICWFFSNPNTPYTGLYQRVVESVFILGIISCATAIKKQNPTTDDSDNTH